MKKERKQDIVYILADYKQLVLEYKSKYASLIKKLHFYKTSCFWLIILLFCMSATMFVWNNDNDRNLAENRNNIRLLNKKIETLSERLQNTRQELATAKNENSEKEVQINKLEQGISSTSKRLLEQLLSER